MKRKMVVGCLLFASVFPLRQAWGRTRCGGGSEGPKPFQDISSQLIPGAQLIKTDGGLAEFTLVEGQDTVLYRDLNQTLNRISLPEKETIGLGPIPGPLSPLIDRLGLFPMTETHSILDPRSGKWVPFEAEIAGAEPLYWHEDELTLVSEKDSAGGEQAFQMYRYLPYENQGVLSCVFSAVGMGLKVAHGNEFPFLYLYGSTPGAQGPALVIYKLDVRNCSVVLEFDFNDPLTGPVRDVFRFENRDGYAVLVDHPTKNLLWETNTSGCRYFDMQGLYPFVGNYAEPIVATWSQSEGVGVFNLETEKKAVLLKGLPVSEITPRDFRMTSDGAQVFLSPQMKGETSRSLLQIQLRGLN